MEQPAFIESYLLDGDILVIKLHGSLDSSKTQEFNDEIKKHLEAGRHKIIIDCSHLGYITSLGIGALMALETRLRRIGGAVKMAAVQGPVSEVLSLVRLDKILGMYGDIEYARESFQEADAS